MKRNLFIIKTRKRYEETAVGSNTQIHVNIVSKMCPITKPDCAVSLPNFGLIEVKNFKNQESVPY